MKTLLKFVKDSSGTVAIEYGILSLIAVGIVVVVGLMTTNLVAKFTTVAAAIAG